MSFGYSAGYGDVIDEALIRKVKGCKDLLDRLHNYFNRPEQSVRYMGDDVSEYVDEDAAVFDFEIFAECCNGNGPYECDDKSMELYEALRKEFNKQTGLELTLQYHDKKQGSSYDDVEGAFWTLDGLYVPSAEYKKFQKKFGKVGIERKHWVVGG